MKALLHNGTIKVPRSLSEKCNPCATCGIVVGTLANYNKLQHKDDLDISWLHLTTAVANKLGAKFIRLWPILTIKIKQSRQHNRSKSNKKGPWPWSSFWSQWTQSVGWKFILMPSGDGAIWQRTFPFKNKKPFTLQSICRSWPSQLNFVCSKSLVTP